MSHRCALIASTGWLILGLFPLFLAQAGSPERETKAIDEFLATLDKNQAMDARQRQRLVKLVESLRNDEYSRTLAITEGLRELYPEFRAALEALGGEDLTPAIHALSQLAKSDDLFLATDASFYLAQAYTFVERFEDAIPLLKTVINEQADKTLQLGEATFLLGVTQARSLLREEAIETFTQFLNENPNVPERMRIGAWRQREQLKMLEEGTLADVYDRMDYSRRRLQLERSDQQTQAQQDEIINMLAKLIKEAEECECNCAGGGQGQPSDGSGEGQGQGTQGGNSRNEDGIVRRTYQKGPESPWSRLRDRQRDPAFSAIKERFPARYQQLIEQYYKSFQNEGK